MIFLAAATGSAATAANLSIWVIIVPATLTLIGTAATMFAARYSARRAGETDTIKLGVTELVDQLREERTHLSHAFETCQGECAALRRDLTKANARLTQAETSLRGVTHELVQANHELAEMKGKPK